MREESINRFLHSRYGLLLMLTLSAVAVAAAYASGSPAWLSGSAVRSPLGFDPAEWLPAAPGAALALAGGLNLLATLLLIYINKHYNVLRSMSLLFAGLFLVMEAATPTLGMADGGMLLAIVVLAATVALYATFQQPQHTQQLFLSFCTVSAGALVDIACAPYLVALAMGCFQMRCTSPRCVVAALLGIATPWWIAWGFGGLDLAQLRAAVLLASPAAADGGAAVAHTLACVAATLLLGTGFGLFNLLKIYSYNARTRAYNGFIVVLAAVTMLLMVCDYGRLGAYLPLLNACAAIQMGHFFVINNRRRSYVAILCIVGLYAGLYAAGLLL